MTLYNITEQTVKASTKTSQPVENKVAININKAAVQSYLTNSYGGKFGGSSIKAMATPILIRPEGYLGSFLYTEKSDDYEDFKLHWFKAKMHYS